MRNNILKNSRENKKKILPVFFTFLVVGMIFSFSYLALSQTTDSNTNIKGKDLSLNIYPSDTIQKEIQYTTTQVNNQTGENETITRTKHKNTDIIKVTNSDFYIKDNGNVEINLDIELTEIGQILSGAPGQMDYIECANELNNKNYTFNGGSFTSTIAQDLRNELEDLSFSVLSGEEVESERNIPKGLAVNPHDTFSVKVVMNPDFSENYKYASFKLGSHSTNIDLTPSLTSYYSLEETSGDVIDSHGTNNGTNNGATRGVTGIINNAFDFDGTDDYVNIGYPSDLTASSLGDSVSISIWFRADSTSADFSMGHRVIGKNSGSHNDNIGISVRDNDFWVYLDTKNSDIEQTLGYSAQTGVWYHFVYVYDGSTLKAYVNGTEEFSQSITGNIEDASGSPWTIGARGTDQRYYDGKIDEVGIWDRALNSTEVSTLYSRYDTDNLGYPEVIEGAEAGLNVNTLEAGNVTTLSANLRGNLTSLGE
ncbi:MAG TPA: LamG domain-containing protein, partial [Candidatus Mcinerneyibacterium sp.]|nr:LamG domain-containing protein [Candidatus Mcinerneyibacterium sp.]